MRCSWEYQLQILGILGIYAQTDVLTISLVTAWVPSGILQIITICHIADERDLLCALFQFYLWQTANEGVPLVNRRHLEVAKHLIR